MIPPLFVYLKDIEKLVALKQEVRTIEEFSHIDHLDRALCIRSAHRVRSLFKRLANS